MDKLTSNSAILRSEVKTQVEFDLLVAVCRASDMPLVGQEKVNLNNYNDKYLSLNFPEGCLQGQSQPPEGQALINFEDAVFSLAKQTWTHIYRGKGTGSFYYGNDKGKHFNISENARTSCSTADFSNYTLIATREPQVVEPPNPTFKVGDVVKYKNGIKKRIIFIDDKSAALENLCGGDRHFIQRNSFGNFEKVMTIREQLIAILDDADYDPDENADRLLKLFNVTEKS